MSAELKQVIVPDGYSQHVISTDESVVVENNKQLITHEHLTIEGNGVLVIEDNGCVVIGV